MKTTILILLVGVLAVAAVSALKTNKIEEDFAHFLKGEVPVLDSDIMKMYQSYLSEYRSKKFDVHKDMNRFTTFKNKIRTIISHNNNPENTWEMGINHLTDMTDEEVDNYYRIMAPQKCSATASLRNFYNDELTPSSFDWRSKSAISPVKDQKSCGSCWAFATTGAMEAHYQIASWLTNEVILSEQQLLDCAGAAKYDCHGCSGGLPSYAFNYIKDFGIEEENTYPYQARDTSCRFNKTQDRITTTGPYNITSGDEKQMKEELYWQGPIAVAFQVVSDFRDYKSGVYSSTLCKNGSMDVNHAVLAVGFGSEKNVDYWIVKNSWGEHWGDEGYFKIKRGDNMCGIATCSSYPLKVKKA